MRNLPIYPHPTRLSPSTLTSHHLMTPQILITHLLVSFAASIHRMTVPAAAAASRAAGEVSSSLTTSSASSARQAGWSPQQQCFRSLMKSLRAAYFNDRSKLFWARHRATVEFYKYAKIEDQKEVDLLVGIANEISVFIGQYMKTDVERIVSHNEKIMTLPVEQAKKFRNDFFLAEKQHETWCKQRIRGMMERRPPPPYPFY